MWPELLSNLRYVNDRKVNTVTGPVSAGLIPSSHAMEEGEDSSSVIPQHGFFTRNRSRIAFGNKKNPSVCHGAMDTGACTAVLTFQSAS